MQKRLTVVQFMDHAPHDWLDVVCIIFVFDTFHHFKQS